MSVIEIVTRFGRSGARSLSWYMTIFGAFSTTCTKLDIYICYQYAKRETDLIESLISPHILSYIDLVAEIFEKKR